MALDGVDPLRTLRSEFVVPDGIYLDGNSLGPMPHCARTRVLECLDGTWSRDLIASWNTAGWVDLPRTVATKIAPLIGADAGSVRVADSTSVNLFKVLAAALALRPDRRRIVSLRSNFPSDLYVAEGLTGLMGGTHALDWIDAPDDPTTAIREAMGPDVAVLLLTHVDYRTGRMLDMEGLTEAAHEAGALAVWDLAHSTGAVPVDLVGAGADFAVGCGYKFLNGGPGAPAHLFVAPQHHRDARNPLSGWFAHAEPFAFDPAFRADGGVDRFLCGTPPVLSTLALDAALELWRDIDLRAVRQKSITLGDLLIARIEGGAADLGLELASPRNGNERGSQVSFRYANAFPLVSALIERGITGDFRAPNIARFGLTPLYTRYQDVWDAAEAVVDVLQSGAWNEPRHHRRRAVT